MKLILKYKDTILNHKTCTAVGLSKVHVARFYESVPCMAIPHN